MAVTYSNSKLVVHTNLSPNYSSRIHSTNPNGEVTRITIHHMAGNCSIEVCGQIFAKKERRASSHYGIGTDGRIGQYLDEKYRPWTSSSRENDVRAVTIEVANNSRGPGWTISDKALASLINLCEDICRRNNIKKLTFTGELEGSNLTMHEWFAATNCPGPYLKSKYDYVVAEVNKRLGADSKVEASVETRWYRVRKSWDDAKSQITACLDLNNAKKAADNNPGYSVFDWNGNKVYPQGAAAVKPAVTPETIANVDRWIWDFLSNKGLNDFAVAGIMGNLKAESNLVAINLQQTYEKSLGYTDETYTYAVDAGTYTKFVTDKAGYGLAQWTYHTRKQKLLDFAKSEGKSIGSTSMQMDFLWKELQGYKNVMAVLKSCKSVQAASDVVLIDFEAPAAVQQPDTCAKAKKTRAALSQAFYDKFAAKVDAPAPKDDKNITLEYGVGDRVMFKGNVQYVSSDATSGVKAAPCTAKVTAVAKAGKHPYHVRAIDASGDFVEGKVHGWVDSNGLSAYVSAATSFAAYTVQVKITNLNIRKGPGTNYDKVGVTGAGKFTIVGESSGKGATKWGKLKSGLGWISLDYATKVSSTTQTTTNTASKKPYTTAQLEAVAKDVINGKYGNGETRKAKLKAAGYPYDEVQEIVDKLMSGTYTGSTNKKSNETIAKEVLNGVWGNGDDRVKRLKAAGYDPKVIQSLVNKLAKK